MSDLKTYRIRWKLNGFKQPNELITAYSADIAEQFLKRKHAGLQISIITVKPIKDVKNDTRTTTNNA